MSMLQQLLLAAPELHVLLTLLCTWAVFWFFAMPLFAKHMVMPYVLKQRWKDRWCEIQKKIQKAVLNIEFPNDRAAMDFFVDGIPLLFQHILGALLCVPSLLAIGPTYVTSAMACHGLLSEAGWELMDILKRGYEVVCGGEEGKAKNPTAFLILSLIHHVMGQTMIIPVIIYYHDNLYVHEFCFLLQGGAGAALLLSSYGYTIDITTAAGLRQMKVVSTTTLAMILYTRCFRYVYVAYFLTLQIYGDGHTVLFGFGVVALCLMGLINMLFCTEALSKFLKFFKMQHTDDAEHVQRTLVHMSSSFHRQNSAVIMDLFLTDSQKRWSKIRGVVHMGVLHETKKTDSAAKAAEKKRAGDKTPVVRQRKTAKEE